MTTAQKISARFGNDGQAFTDAAGYDIGFVCATMAARTVARSGGDRKYVFDYDSAIVVMEGGWDIALDPTNDDCWCMVGLGRCECAAGDENG